MRRSQDSRPFSLAIFLPEVISQEVAELGRTLLQLDLVSLDEKDATRVKPPLLDELEERIPFLSAPFGREITRRKDDHQRGGPLDRAHDLWSQQDVAPELVIRPERETVLPAQQLSQAVVQFLDQRGDPSVLVFSIGQVIDMGIADKNIMSVAGDVTHE